MAQEKIAGWEFRTIPSEPRRSSLPPSHQPKKPKLLFLLAAIVLITGMIFGAGYLAQRHRTAIVSVPQSQVNKVSVLSRKIGVPTTTYPADQSMHLIIYYDGYTDPAEGQRYVGLVEATLRTMQPYATLHNMQVTVLTSGTPKCHVVTGVKNILKCDPGLIPEVNALHFDHFKLGILSPLNFVPSATVARGKNSAFYVSTYRGSLTQQEIDVFVSLYFTHELGHALGLRDEYARQRYGVSGSDLLTQNQDTGNTAYQPAAPNCAPDKATAEKWWGNYLKAHVSGVGLYQGCAGYPDYYYPVQNTVMGADPTKAEYGRVSEDYIRGVFNCFYGQQTAMIYPTNETFTGLNYDCKTFEQQYPNFWKN